MKHYKQWLNNFKVSVEFPDVSGFEILETLQLRSNLAHVEEQLSLQERSELETADATFLQCVDVFYTNVAKIADLQEYRSQKNVLPSHWWWFLDKLVQRKESVSAGA